MVPVFIQLNEINTMPEEKRMNFILSTIIREYFDSRVSEEEIILFFRYPRDIPAVVLLLDGFNEVTVDNKELLIQIRKLMEQARGVQIVITSRYDMRKSFGWGHLHLLELRGLEKKQVKNYLEKKKSKMPSGRLLELLRNPMMLTLYTSTCEVQGKYEGDFKENVETTGELLWNFMEAQVAVLFERLNYDKKKWWFYKFLLKFMLPAAGYEMEKVGLFAFNRETLYRVLDTYCSRFSRADFFQTFTGYDEYEEVLQIGACGDEKARRKRRSEIVEILCDVLLMLVKEGETYRFLHQDFRDYFAALHILEEAEMGVTCGEVADVLKQRALPLYIRRLIGEIEGEHYQKPVFQAGKGWLPKEDRSSLLNRVLDLCRGVFDGSMGFGPWNIVEVWKEVRGDLSGAELSVLDLSRVVLNGTHCSRFFRCDYLAAYFDGSLLNEMSIFPRGHSRGINSAHYSGDGKKILSASNDKTIKEWDVESGQCLKTFTDHEDHVTSAYYSGDGKKILSSSEDKTIKEWDVESGQCLKTFTGHDWGVTSALYSSDGKKILSASIGEIKEWDVESGQCLKTFTEHGQGVTSALYSGDGKKILVTPWNKNIKELDVESGQCLKTFTGHDRGVTSALYSGDGKKILAASRDNTIKEWDVESGQCLKTFTGHKNVVNSALYNGDEEKILSASDDKTIKEWDVESGQCLKTFTGHDWGVTSALYSGDGKKILSASGDKTIKEWDVESGQCLKTFIGYYNLVNSALYRSDREKILTASWDNTIKEWDVESGQCLKTFTGHENVVNSALYNDDGKKILSASDDKTIKEWDVESGQCLKTFTGHKNVVNSALYNGDGKKILSASDDKTIKEWDVESGQCLKTFTGHENSISSAIYSGDGEKILSVSRDKTIKEWDVESGQCLKTFTGHESDVNSALFSSKWEKIFHFSGDRTINEWDVENGPSLVTHIGDLKAEENPGSAGEKFLIYGNMIIISSFRAILNIPGLFIHGCSFKNLHPNNDLSEESKNIMRQYGALIE
jgi:WD40 repeat protein